MRLAISKMRQQLEALKSKFGFTSDYRLPLWANFENAAGKMDSSLLQHQVSNRSCHNLLRNLDLPPGTVRLLGLNLNYCVKPPTINSMIESTFKRLPNDIRRMYHLKDVQGGNYIPSLYLNSDFKFDPASDRLEKSLEQFTLNIKSAVKLLQQRRNVTPNLPPYLMDLMLWFKDHNDYIIVEGDKNLGPCILERSYYIWRAFKDHLGDINNYKQLTPNQAFCIQRGLQYKFRAWLSKFGYRRRWKKPPEYVTLSEAETTFLRRAIKKFPDKLARFRLTCKVHKTPWKTRPIVCCAGTFMNYWSKWLDYWFQKLTPSVPTYLKNGDQLLKDILPLRLPLHARQFVTDAKSMYNNIDTDHALTVITWWIEDLDSRDSLPPGFPTEAVLLAMHHIMKNNLFEFGDLFFLQLLGTAMGTSAAVMWATLYFAYHEVHTIIPKYGHLLLYFKRYIDDIYGVWIGNKLEWTSFSNDLNNFGILKWDITEIFPSKSVNFLDMTLSINFNRIISRTYQKKMNLHLYIPPASEHSPCNIKGIIFSLVQRYFKQNTFLTDFVHFVGLLYYRLILRGWDRPTITNHILEATSKVEKQSPLTAHSLNKDESLENILILHFNYHKDGISRPMIRSIYNKHLGTHCHEDANIERTIVAYSRPKNIGDFVTKAKLHQAPGKNASTILGEFRQGLNPY